MLAALMDDERDGTDDGDEEDEETIINTVRTPWRNAISAFSDTSNPI